jgi:hypothetical protein
MEGAGEDGGTGFGGRKLMFFKANAKRNML